VTRVRYNSYRAEQIPTRSRGVSGGGGADVAGLDDGQISLEVEGVPAPGEGVYPHLAGYGQPGQPGPSISVAPEVRALAQKLSSVNYGDAYGDGPDRFSGAEVGRGRVSSAAADRVSATMAAAAQGGTVGSGWSGGASAGTLTEWLGEVARRGGAARLGEVS
jgi:hypothetical protein